MNMNAPPDNDADIVNNNEEKAVSIPEDYVGPDGLLYCGNCNTPKQFQGTFMGKPLRVASLCKCMQEKKRLMEEEQKERELQAEIYRQKTTCIHDKALMNASFEKDDGSVPQMKLAKCYVDTWPERKAQNDGLLLWGDVGTGKTFLAACIANALIEKGVPVLMTSFPKILNQLSMSYSEDRNEYIRSLMRYHLLIIDDLGIERNTSYATEQLYSVIDERYKSGLPLIVTTNLTLDQIKHPEGIDHYRIYDRILALCAPVCFKGTSHREEEARSKIRDLSWAGKAMKEGGA